jgi:glyoxylase-like metal-dependent hydrolase (beta-lactamase superfamily II)
MTTDPQNVPGAAPIIEALPVGQLAANCYLVICPETRAAALLDPGDEAPRILERVRALDARVTHVIHTHGHFDHISATEAVLAGLPGEPPLAAHPADAYLYADGAQDMARQYGYPVTRPRARPTLELEDGAEIAVGTLRLRVLHTPGHTPGSVSLLLAPWCVFTGDTLFRRGIGRTDLPGGDEDAIYASIETRLYPLDPALAVYPGHGDATTIDEERGFNPFVRGA